MYRSFSTYRYSVAQMCTREDMPAHKLGVPYLDEVMSYYLDKLAHIQVVINCRYSIAQMCTHEGTLAHKLGVPYFDYVMSYNSLTTEVMQRGGWGRWNLFAKYKTKP